MYTCGENRVCCLQEARSKYQLSGFRDHVDKQLALVALMQLALARRRSARSTFLCACGGLFVFGLGCLAFSYLNGEGLVLMHKAAQRNTWLSRQSAHQSAPLVSSTPPTGATLPRNEGSEDLFDGSLTSKLDEVPSPPRPRGHAYPHLMLASLSRYRWPMLSTSSPEA